MACRGCIFDTDTMTDSEAKLRRALKEKPESGKLMAKLSVLLTVQAKVTNNEATKQEALILARKSACLCPNRPAGHLAISMASPHYHERIESLQKVADLWTPLCSITQAALATTLVRLLVEPRDEETNKGRITKHLSENPRKRGLNEPEQNLYDRIRNVTQSAWGEALMTFDTKIQLARAEYRLGLLFRKMEPSDVCGLRFIHHLTVVIEKLPGDHPLTASARFWLATRTDGVVVDRCPKNYIVALYSTFAARFDDLLVGKLSYDTPRKLRKLVDTTKLPYSRKWVVGADLGCGTGLSGEAFRDCVETLVGVDLSPEMIERAKTRGCYETLVVGDVTSILGNEDEYDLLFASDVFVYIGDLSDIFKDARKALKMEGVFAFSTECLAETYDHPFKLHTCARFAHKQSYIESLATDMGYRILNIEKTTIRKNGGKDVEGMLFVMEKG